jgi:hypothetical protein
MPIWNARDDYEPRTPHSVWTSVVMALLSAIWIWSQIGG